MCRVEENQEEPEPADSYLCHVKSRGVAHSPPVVVQVKLDDCLVAMEVDTGASVSIMSKATFGELWPGRILQPS